MKILLVEDDAALGREVARGLRGENFAVDHAGHGEDSLHLGSTGLYGAAVLDLGLPVVSGIAALTACRCALAALEWRVLSCLALHKGRGGRTRRPRCASDEQNSERLIEE